MYSSYGEDFGLPDGRNENLVCGLKTGFSRILVAVVLLTCPSFRSNGAILNGSFEEPVIVENLNFTGAFSFNGWTGFSTGTGGDGNAGIVVGTEFGLSPSDGNQHFSFNGNNPPFGTYIEQTFATTIGKSYSVSFCIARNNGFAEQFLALNAQVFNGAGAQLASLLAQPLATTNYTTKTFAFVADSETSRLRFTDASGANPNTDVFIDAVSIVPEPSSALLLLSGAALLIRRRRIQG